MRLSNRGRINVRSDYALSLFSFFFLVTYCCGWADGRQRCRKFNRVCVCVFVCAHECVMYQMK